MPPLYSQFNGNKKAPLQCGVTVSLFISLLLTASCIAPHPATFAVVSGSPNYRLRSPDRRATPFPDVLHSYNGFERGQNWIYLKPLMGLRIENAYYEKGMPARGLKGFLGTEIANYELTGRGLRLSSVQSMKQRPEGAVPVQHLIAPSRTNFGFYRLYFEILFANGNTHGSVLLGADSPAELDRLSAQLDHPESICGTDSVHCTVFPEACSVSVEMRIVVNGKTQTVIWGMLLESVVGEHPARLSVERLYKARLVPVEINFRDPDALRLPLLPGDRIAWH